MALIIPKREEVKKTNKLVIPTRGVSVEKGKNIREVGFPEHLGGGTYKISDDPDELIRTTRSQSALPAIGTAERDHIISVALGGTSNKENLQYLATTSEGRQSGKVSVEQKAINDYTSGKITLNQARLIVQTKQQQIKGLTPTEKEKTWQGQIGNVIKDAFKKVIKPFTAEGRAEADALNHGLDRDYILKANIASEVLGKEVKPSEFTKVIKSISPEQKNLINAKSAEKTSEVIAQIATAPIRWTAGSLASAITSYALEKSDSNLKYTPKTDTEKLIISENDVERLLNQKDLYGVIARGASVPVAMTTIAILENPFLKGTGAGKLVKEALERQIVKQGEKTLSKLGTKEIIKLADDVIKAEVKAGRMAEKDALKVSKEINGLKVKETTPSSIVEPQKATGKVLTPKTTKVSTVIDSVNPTGGVFTKYDPKTRATAKLANNITTLDKTMKKSPNEMITVYRGAPKNQKGIVAGDFVTTNKQLAKDYAGNGVVLEKNVKLSSILDDVKEPLGEEYIYKPIDKAVKKVPIKYVPEEKPVDLRKKITTEKLIAEPSVPNRIKNEAIEKGIKADFQGIEEYDKVSFKDQAKKVGQIIDEDPEKAIRIALGKELPTNGALPESVFIAVKNQAIKKGDTELLIRLATEEGGVAKESTVLGQRIKMLDEQLEDDAFKNINDVIKNRKANATKKGLDVSKAKKEEVSKLKDAIKKSAPKKDEWAEFLETIKCK